MGEEVGEELLTLARRSKEELLLVAPYVKVGTLSRILGACPADATVKVVTRWRIEEIAIGVSDLEVWPLLKARGGSLWLHASLHAKFYRAGDSCLVGSANLTDAALGWRNDPNLEILTKVGPTEYTLASFERDLWSRARPVNDTVHAAFVRALEAFPPRPPIEAIEPPPPFDDWRPRLRFPEDLWKAYVGDLNALTVAAREVAAGDLASLAPPPGLTRRQFDACIGLELRQHPEVTAIDAFLTKPRRFGEVTNLLARRGVPDADRAWQTWMRWFLHFLPEDYDMKVANYSEIFEKREAAGADRSRGFGRPLG